MNISTLHICNLDEVKVKDMDFYWSILAPDDQVILYAKIINQNQYEELQLQQPRVIKHFQSMSNNKFQTINMQQWLQLVKQAQRTMTWK